MISRSVFGIIGLGRIGHYVARVVSAMGAHVIWYDPYSTSTLYEKCDDLNELARRSHVISLHATESLDNKHMISYPFFDSINQANVVFINTARGSLVSNEALLEALRLKKISAAALDTIDGEFTPDFESKMASHPLIAYAESHSNLLITPHIAGSTLDAWSETESRVIHKSNELLSTL